MKTDHPAKPKPETDRDFTTVPANAIERTFGKQWHRFHKALKCARKKPSPKNVHVLRVTTRRLLAWHQLLAEVTSPAIAKRNCALLKKSFRAFGDLRDTQIQKKIVKELSAGAAGPFYKWLCRRETRLTRKARKSRRPAAILYKAAERCVRKELRRRLKKLPPDAVGTQLVKATRQAFQAATTRRDQARPADTKTIHKARVALKEYRYMFSAAAAAPSPRLLDKMRRHQDLMGKIQDLETLLARLEKYQRRHGGEVGSVQILARDLTRQRAHLISVYFRAAGNLDHLWPTEPKGASQKS